jgi:hypothetical protein
MDIRRIMITNVNELYAHNELKKLLLGYTECEIHNSLKYLFDKNFLNKKVIDGKSYYWIKM